MQDIRRLRLGTGGQSKINVKRDFSRSFSNDTA
jgi:hypothetical protein